MNRITMKMAVLVLAGFVSSGAVHAADVIGYITKSATNAGWMMINQGAEDAAKEEGVNLVAVGPAFQGDLSSQLEVFENLVAQGAKAIGIAPVDSAGVAPAVNDAMASGIPIIAMIQVFQVLKLHLLWQPIIMPLPKSRELSLLP